MDPNVLRHLSVKRPRVMRQTLLRMIGKALIAGLSLCLSLLSARGQEQIIRDTLSPSVIEDARARRFAGVQVVESSQIRGLVSAMGESDYIKYFQTLPGVATGADGSSAVYVRGGNLGGNVVTLDGVPVYGASHLLGFTTVLSNDVVERTEFQVGGFSSEEGNLSSSHIRLFSTSGSFESWHASGNVSNFLVGASASGPIVKYRVSLVLAVRYSPLGLEYRLVDGMIPAVDDLAARVYDLYGKVAVRLSDRQTLEGYLFRSVDDFRFKQGGTTQDRMGWSNLIGKVEWSSSIQDNLKLSVGGYWSSRSSLQSQEKAVLLEKGTIPGIVSSDETVLNFFSICDSLREGSLRTQICWHKDEHWTLSGGIQWRYATFNPGASSSYSGSLLRPEHSITMSDNRMHANTGMGHVQVEYQDGEHIQLRGAFRWSRHGTSGNRGKVHRKGEFSLMGKWGISDQMGVEGTVDHLAQFYHTLEGLPLGWSLDMVVPSDQDFAPEVAQQYYLGAYLEGKRHYWHLGGYWKRMKNLLYFEDGGNLFSGSLGSWRSNVFSGKGRSYGVEVTYEYQGNRLKARGAYTLSKTDRQFEFLNEGKPFPAKFDRRHILNASGDFMLTQTTDRKMGFISQLTLQSGSWETVPVGHYAVPMLDGKEVKVHLFSSLNNFRMPAVFRWDIGWYMEKALLRTKHRLHVGIYNVTNRHNPFLITYDGEAREWRQISLLPIMPSLSYRIAF